MFSQPDLERTLDARVRALPSVEVRRAREVVGIQPAPDDVGLAAAHPDGTRSEVRARYVVGCDGANSFVRRHLGAPVTDLGFFFDWLIVDVVPREPRVWDPINGQLCEVGVVLQRPDFHVFRTAPTVDGASTLVRQLRTALAGG